MDPFPCALHLSCILALEIMIKLSGLKNRKGKYLLSGGVRYKYKWIVAMLGVGELANQKLQQSD